MNQVGYYIFLAVFIALIIIAVVLLTKLFFAISERDKKLAEENKKKATIKEQPQEEPKPSQQEQPELVLPKVEETKEEVKPTEEKVEPVQEKEEPTTPPEQKPELEIVPKDSKTMTVLQEDTISPVHEKEILEHSIPFDPYEPVSATQQMQVIKEEPKVVVNPTKPAPIQKPVVTESISLDELDHYDTEISEPAPKKPQYSDENNYKDSFKKITSQTNHSYTQLQEIKDLSDGAQFDMRKLNQTIASIKGKGKWNIISLNEILEKVCPGMYLDNYRLGVNNQIVEYVLIIPDSQDESHLIYLPIQTCYPEEEFIRLKVVAEHGDDHYTKSARNELEKKVWFTAKRLTTLIQPDQTTDYVIMYIPSEALYAELGNSKNHLLPIMDSKLNVLALGPNSLIALLSSMNQSFKLVRINDITMEIQKNLEDSKPDYNRIARYLRSK